MKYDITYPNPRELMEVNNYYDNHVIFRELLFQQVSPNMPPYLIFLVLSMIPPTSFVKPIKISIFSRSLLFLFNSPKENCDHDKYLMILVQHPYLNQIEKTPV